MKKGRKCNCILAALTAFVTILIIAYVPGYTMGKWTITTWLAGAVIMVLVVSCIWCRGQEDEENESL